MVSGGLDFAHALDSRYRLLVLLMVVLVRR